jgi:hypothetical protein
MTLAIEADFFGDSGGGFVLDPYANVKRPQRTAEQIAEEERQRIHANYVRGLDANGNPLPAYGTPRSQGGTAQGYQVTTPAPIGTQNMTQSALQGRQVYNSEGLEPSRVVRGDINHNGQFQPGMNSGGTPTGGNQGVADDLAVGRGLADEVLGSNPTVDPNNRVTRENMDRLTPVVDPALARNAEIDRAFAMSEDLVNRIMNAPSQTQQIADRSLSQQLALGRSSPGGIGAVQSGIKTAMGAAPQLQAQATQASIQEQQARAQAATGAANIYAGVAAGTADREVRIAEANQGAGLSVLNNLTTLTGQDYAFDTAKMQSVGQLARDFFANAQAFAQMDVQTQIAQWNDMTNRYGIDATLKAAMEQIAASENIGPLDAFKLVLGGVSAVGGLAAGGA